MSAADLARLALAALLPAASGCARATYNARLAAFDPASGYRAAPPASGRNTDEVQVILTFSGGGTRAAAFAYGVLKELRATKIQAGSKSLLDEVDLISSISGGSFTNAYFGLFGDRIFEDFERRFLLRDIESELAWKLANPYHLLRLASPYFNRIHLAAELYDATVFDRATFGDIARRAARPFVLVNATTMSLGTLFEFTQDQFDHLGSDLSGYPVASAVAASSAFPILLSPITVKAYDAPAGWKEPEWIGNALGDRAVNLRRWNRARSLRALQDRRLRPWVHLLDGGLADNLGVRPVIARLADPEGPGSLAARIQEGKVKRLAVIVVNSKVEPPGRIDANENGPGVFDVFVKTSTTAMDNYSYDSVEWLRSEKRERDRTAVDLAAYNKLLVELGRGSEATELPAVRSYVIEVAFDAIADDAERAWFLSLPTTFRLPPEAVGRLVAKAGELLRADPGFQSLVADLR